MSVFKIANLCFLFILSYSSSYADLRNFVRVEPGIYRGSQPRTSEDFNELKSHGIRTILNLRWRAVDIEPERAKAFQNGFTYISQPISPISFNIPKGDIVQIINTMTNPDLQPVYIHCLLGEDRTGMIIGLYRIHVQRWAPDLAYREMKEAGFKPFMVPGLYLFFNAHKDKGTLLPEEELLPVKLDNLN
jgi:protein tyrosine/serine phosphatase